MKNIPIINDPNIGPEGSGRSCGSCFMCCIVLTIPEIDKPAGRRCQYVDMGRTEGACSIYFGNRPQRCAEFRCAWLDGWFPEEYRPDRIKGVVTTGDDGQSLILHEHERYEGVASNALRPVIDDLALNGVPVFVVCGSARKMIVMNPEVMKNVNERIDRAIGQARTAPDGDRPEDLPAPEKTGDPAAQSSGDLEQNPGGQPEGRHAPALEEDARPADAGSCAGSPPAADAEDRDR